MSKLPAIGVLATLLIIIAGVFVFTKDNSSTTLPAPTSYEYYWGDGCPHCKNVEDFISSWDKKDKVQIDKKEVWNNQGNARVMQQRAKSCNIPLTDMGVPFMVTPEGKCLSGDTPIIDYLKSLEI